jgi:hypothetical protein
VSAPKRCSIEAPWLVNGGHGASLRLPCCLPPRTSIGSRRAAGAGRDAAAAAAEGAVLGEDDEGESAIEAHFTLSNLESVYDASDVFEGAVQEVDVEVREELAWFVLVAGGGVLLRRRGW